MDFKNMPAKYQQLLTLLNSFECKISELAAFRLSNNYGSYSKIVDESQLCMLEKHLETDLLELSRMFDVDRKSAIILCSMFFNSCMDGEGLFSRAVPEGDLGLSVCLDPYVFSDLSEAIFELENRNIITVTYKNDSGEKVYALTQDFINTITTF